MFLINRSKSTICFLLFATSFVVLAIFLGCDDSEEEDASTITEKVTTASTSDADLGTFVASAPGGRVAGCFPTNPVIFAGPYTQSIDLPLGEWTLIANSRVYTLNITAVVGTNVTATLSSGDITNATWDGTSGILTFIRDLPLIPLTQEFTGYLFHYDDNDPKWRMAGIFGDVEFPPESNQWSGWYATMPR